MYHTITSDIIQNTSNSKSQVTSRRHPLNRRSCIFWGKLPTFSSFSTHPQLHSLLIRSRLKSLRLLWYWHRLEQKWEMWFIGWSYFNLCVCFFEWLKMKNIAYIFRSTMAMIQSFLKYRKDFLLFQIGIANFLAQEVGHRDIHIQWRDWHRCSLPLRLTLRYWGSTTYLLLSRMKPPIGVCTRSRSACHQCA